ncbi:MAG: TlpA family protein disulfide reductase [Deltaproteobacteria bacterium]|nr:TlpA family protein disulfide reductase [Deltaproteobacteria bacterium]
MKAKVTVSIIVLLLPLAGLILSRESFSNRGKDPASTEDYLSKKLNIEISERGKSAPDFELLDLTGKPVRLQNLRARVIFLNFWATWCPPCRLEMPTMEELHKEFRSQGLVLLAINYRESAAEVKAFLEEHRFTFPVLFDREGKAFDLYQAWSLPTTYLIGKNGEIVGRVVGYRDWHSEQARALFRQLLEDKA